MHWLSAAPILFSFFCITATTNTLTYNRGHTMKSGQRVGIRCYLPEDPKKFEVSFKLKDIQNVTIVEASSRLSRSLCRVDINSAKSNTTGDFPFQIERLDNGQIFVVFIVVEEQNIWHTGGILDYVVSDQAKKPANDVRYFDFVAVGDLIFCEEPATPCSER